MIKIRGDGSHGLLVGPAKASPVARDQGVLLLVMRGGGGVAGLVGCVYKLMLARLLECKEGEEGGRVTEGRVGFRSMLCGRRMEGEDIDW